MCVGGGRRKRVIAERTVDRDLETLLINGACPFMWLIRPFPVYLLNPWV